MDDDPTPPTTTAPFATPDPAPPSLPGSIERPPQRPFEWPRYGVLGVLVAALVTAVIGAGLATADELSALKACEREDRAVINDLRADVHDLSVEVKHLELSAAQMRTEIADARFEIDHPHADGAQSVFTRGGHNKITCTTTGVNIAINDSAGTPQPLTEITLANPTATIVRIISSNGVATANGLPICTDAACVGSTIRLPTGSGVFKCATDSGTASVYLLGGSAN